VESGLGGGEGRLRVEVPGPQTWTDRCKRLRPPHVTSARLGVHSLGSEVAMARVGLDTQDWGQGGAGGGARPPGTPRPRPKELWLCVPRRSAERDFVASRTSCSRGGACQTPQRPQVVVTAVTGHDGDRTGGRLCYRVVLGGQSMTKWLHRQTLLQSRGTQTCCTFSRAATD